MRRKAKKQAAPKQSPIDPRIAVKSYQPLLTPAEYEMLTREIDQPLLPAIRLNPLKTGKDFKDFLQAKYGWTLEPIPFCSSGYRVITNGDPEVSSVLEHKLGMFYIQEAASMLPVELFTINDAEENICLDLAASPGGKINSSDLKVV
jgi:16S rRNA (cytosine1407-C5)-methyltransferase